ncbi:MAG: hypothetical protein [Wendovervirus sonii]|uniref:YopX protein domain-containing protein n=1 Tax=phage Lak_Megaphage_Sonny TaxID=3109229 RepID=A0ABZ0Z6R4_9CAUD|nr:MAG: hypothetical protein [phage Lak_Megaphage_Sonny]
MTLSPENKMDLWHNGSRKQNIRSCNDEKLINYYKICCEKGYAKEANIIHSELIIRDIEPDEMVFGQEPVLDLHQICDYIENHMTINGDCGEDLFKFTSGNKLFYSWSCGMDDKMDGYECMVDFSKRIVEIDGITMHENETLKILQMINDNLFGC